jgi:hypothetical protein
VPTFLVGQLLPRPLITGNPDDSKVFNELRVINPLGRS